MIRPIHIKVKLWIYSLGVAFEAMGKFNEAILMYDRAIKINPNNALTYYNKGFRLIYLKEILYQKWDNLKNHRKCIIGLFK